MSLISVPNEASIQSLKSTAKGPVNLGENSSFIFTICVKSVPRYHFKFAYVILQMAVKEFFETHFQQ